MPTWYPELDEDLATGPTASMLTGGPRPMTYGLPPELLAGGLHRLGIISFSLAILLAALLVLYHVAQEAGQAGFAATLVGGFWGTMLAVVMIVLSGAMGLLTRVRWLPPPTVLDLGMLYAVLCSIGIAMLENFVHWPQDDVVRGVSWVCLWIVMFPMMVPATPGKTFLTCVACASMGPVAYMGMVTAGRPAAPIDIVAGMFLPNYAAVLLAMMVSRVLYRLGKRVSEARQMGNYKLVERLGRGGMGEVWRADHRRLARSAAVKFIRRDTLTTSSAGDLKSLIRRFEREASATARLRSPHTVELYDFGVTPEGTLYYVLELLDGLDTETLVRRFGPLPPERVVFLLVQACRSLAEAHQLKLVHRDIKPANVLVCRLGNELDFVKILDFGLVRSTVTTAEPQTQLTAAGQVGGTPAYIAPEMVVDADSVGHSADIYGLGCVAYYLLTGQLVFEGQSSMSILVEHVRSTPVPPSERTELAIPADLEQVVLDCLAKTPTDRPKSAEELERRLLACELERAWTPERAREWWERHAPDLLLVEGTGGSRTT